MDDPGWTRAAPAPRTVPTPLSRDAIVAAAIALADADGLDGVSLRKVAAALGAGPMRLYRHVAGKAALLDLMVDAVLAATDGTADAGWRPALRDHAHGLWAAVGRHEWLADLLGQRPQLGPGALRRLDAALAPVLAVADADVARTAVAAVDAYVTGAARRAVAERRATRATGDDEAAWQAAIGPYLARVLAAGEHPAVAALVEDAATPDADAEFEDGLELVLDGVAARLAG